MAQSHLEPSHWQTLQRPSVGTPPTLLLLLPPMPPHRAAGGDSPASAVLCSSAPVGIDEASIPASCSMDRTEQPSLAGASTPSSGSEQLECAASSVL